MTTRFILGLSVDRFAYSSKTLTRLAAGILARGEEARLEAGVPDGVVRFESRPFSLERPCFTVLAVPFLLLLSANPKAAISRSNSSSSERYSTSGSSEIGFFFGAGALVAVGLARGKKGKRH